jgi:hypothetical protein
VTANGTWTDVVDNTLREETFTFQLDAQPLELHLDPGNWILKSQPSPVSTVMLRSPWPNPAAGSTTISYFLSEETEVSLRIFDLLGRCVRTLVDDRRQGREHLVAWNGRDAQDRLVGSGVYYLLLQTGSGTGHTPLVVIR